MSLIEKMSAQIIDGKKISAQIREKIKLEVEELRTKGIYPGLSVILVGDNPASHTYVRLKEKACEECGIYSRSVKIASTASEMDVLEQVQKLNSDTDIHGILVQLPLPSHINKAKIISAIDPRKDVDGLHVQNLGRLFSGDNPIFIPCTPAGILELIKSTGIEIKGKHAVVIGRSEIVGKPTALLLLQEHATVTICHSRTPNLSHFTKDADIIVAAVGKFRLVTKDMVKKDAVVIDVGTNVVGGKLIGDVDFENVKEIASYITPVPGGVGPMTIAMLLKNTVKSASL